MAARQAPLSLEFCCTAKWFSYKYTHILHFKNSFPLWFIPGDWIEFPVLYSRTLLFIHPRYNSLHLLIPNSQSILPLLLSHLVTTRCKEAALIEGAGGCWELFIMLAHFCTHTPPHHTQVQPHTYTQMVYTSQTSSGATSFNCLGFSSSVGYLPIAKYSFHHNCSPFQFISFRYLFASHYGR